MALKATLDSIDGLPDLVKKEYKQDSAGKFHLDVDGIHDHPDVGALKRAKDYEVEERKKATARAATLEQQVGSLTEERDGMLKSAIPKADVDKLEKSYQDKLNGVEKSYKDRLAAADQSLNTLLVDNVAQKLASEVSTAPELLIPHIRGRLKAELVDGKPLTRVLDKDGSPTALNIDDFKKEVVANPMFAPIIIGSKASGSRTPDGAQTQVPAGSAQKSLVDMNPTELAAYMTSKQGG